MAWLVAGFFVTALLYASVGFGGGSTYSALLALAEVDYRVLPLISLCCNIVVVAGSTVRFMSASMVPWRGALGLTCLAAPAALLGGLTPIDQGSFLTVLGFSLLFAGATLLFPVNGQRAQTPHRLARLAPLAAVPLGYLAGLVGIGGGIFLAPFLHLTQWDETRRVAAATSVFILVNSAFGIIGQLLKGGFDRLETAVAFGLPLLVAVAIGGQIGSFFALRLFPVQVIRLLTAALTIWIGARLVLTS